MADLTYDSPLQVNNVRRNTQPFTIKNGVQLYLGMLCKLAAGYADKHAAGAGTVIAGVAIEGGTPGNDPNLDGNTSGQAIGPGNTGATFPPKVIIECGAFVARQVTLAVAGTLAGTIADVGTELYCATSNIADASTTQTSTDKPLGRIVAFYSASGGNAIYDIEVYDFDTRKAR